MLKASLLPASLLLTFSICTLASGQDKNEWTPVETRNYRDLSLPFLRLDPRPWVLDRGEKSISVSFVAANDVRKMFVGNTLKVYEDYENDVLNVRYRKGLGNGVDVTFDGSLISRGGGFLDPIVDGWHHILGLVNNLRTGIPYGQCVIDIPGSGPYHDAIGIGDISAEITKAFNTRLMGTVGVKIPTGNAHQILGSGNFDGAIDVQYRLPISSRWMMQFQGGVVAQGTSTELQGTRGLNPQAAIVVMHRANKFDNYVFQWQSEESGIVTGVGGSDSPHRVLTASYQRHFSGGRMAEVYITDNGDFVNTFHTPEVANIGPEPTIGVRWVTHF